MNKDDDEDKDLRKEIEELEKMIEIVKQQHKEEKNSQKKISKQNNSGMIRIDLAARYSSSLPINLIVSYLVNFILIYAIMKFFSLGYASVDYIYLIIAAMFTIYEEIYKWFLLKFYPKVVLYSSGLIFFLMNIMFFYFVDLVVFKNSFFFENQLFPIMFVIVFQIIRMIVKSVYVGTVRKINFSRRKSNKE
ncbi:MAG TPA: hypothetical protein P5042_02275 [Candidatus Izemoplasmatales bacterium]|nr:hypothetical protein [Candidatus Izemoplasmatales bacterium]